MDKTVFGIATIETTTAGHGDSFDEAKIITVNGYGTGDYPPIFGTRKAAEAWISTLDEWRRRDIKVIELTLVS